VATLVRANPADKPAGRRVITRNAQMDGDEASRGGGASREDGDGESERWRMRSLLDACNDASDAGSSSRSLFSYE